MRDPGNLPPDIQRKVISVDPKKLPANNCRSPGLPSIAMTPDLQEWTVTDGKLAIVSAYKPLSAAKISGTAGVGSDAIGWYDGLR